MLYALAKKKEKKKEKGETPQVTGEIEGLSCSLNVHAGEQGGDLETAILRLFPHKSQAKLSVAVFCGLHAGDFKKAEGRSNGE